MNSFFRQPAGSEFPKGWEALPSSWESKKLTWGNDEQAQSQARSLPPLCAGKAFWVLSTLIGSDPTAF